MSRTNTNTTTPAAALPQLSLGVSAPGGDRYQRFGSAGAAPAEAERPVAWPVLAKGTLVKVGISWLVDHLLQVVVDPGPARRADRLVEVRRQEAERRHEVYRVKRYNVSLPRVQE
jgi:hypothetical protein